MLYTALKTIHLLSVIVWIGGMVFAHFCLRPAVAKLEAPERVRLMSDVLGRFFKIVLVAAALVLGSGSWMIGRTAAHMSQAGVKFNMPLAWMLMSVLGLVMMAIFGHIRFTLYKRLAQAAKSTDWREGGMTLASIRTWVMVNILIGVLIVAITVQGVPS